MTGILCNQGMMDILRMTSLKLTLKNCFSAADLAICDCIQALLTFEDGLQESGMGE